MGQGDGGGGGLTLGSPEAAGDGDGLTLGSWAVGVDGGGDLGDRLGSLPVIFMYCFFPTDPSVEGLS